MPRRRPLTPIHSRRTPRSRNAAGAEHPAAGPASLLSYHSTQQQLPYRPRTDRVDLPSLRYADTPGYAPSERHARRSTSRSHSRSRGSSMSLDEMLLEATTGDVGRPNEMGGLQCHPLAHLRLRNRSQSPEHGEYLAVPHHQHHHCSHSRGSPASHAHQLQPSAAASGPGVSPPRAGTLSPLARVSQVAPTPSPANRCPLRYRRTSLRPRSWAHP